MKNHYKKYQFAIMLSILLNIILIAGCTSKTSTLPNIFNENESSQPGIDQIALPDYLFLTNEDICYMDILLDDPAQEMPYPKIPAEKQIKSPN